MLLASQAKIKYPIKFKKQTETFSVCFNRVIKTRKDVWKGEKSTQWETQEQRVSLSTSICLFTNSV